MFYIFSTGKIPSVCMPNFANFTNYTEARKSLENQELYITISLEFDPFLKWIRPTQTNFKGSFITSRLLRIVIIKAQVSIFFLVKPLQMKSGNEGENNCYLDSKPWLWRRILPAPLYPTTLVERLHFVYCKRTIILRSFCLFQMQIRLYTCKQRGFQIINTA